MKHLWAGAIAVTLLSACGSNPFVDTTGTDVPVEPPVATPDPTPEPSIVPASIQNDVGSYTFNVTTGELTIEGVNLEADALTATYTRKPALDRAGYSAYTNQEDPLQRHSTAYVKQIDGTSAVVVLSGQFGQFLGGASFSRSGDYDPVGDNVTPDGGLVSYVGQYVGLLNARGDGGDLLPVPPGTPPALTPGQSAEVTGLILINADFTDNSVNGGITNRVIVDDGTITPEDLDLEVAAINADGTFAGSVLQNNQSRGEYGGIFGGVESSTVAGALHAADHISQLDDEEEFGIFVLVQCGQPGADPICP